MDRKKVLELDKICRVCICERKEMRPLFTEKVAEMLMDITNVKVQPTEGWPDKICVQCVHAVSRNYAFKSLVERSDKELREYIKSLTVRVVIDETQQSNKSNDFFQQQDVQEQQRQKQEQEHQKQQKQLQKQIKQQQQQIDEQQIKLIQQQEMLHQQLNQPILVVQQSNKQKNKPIARKNQRQPKKPLEQQEITLAPQEPLIQQRQQQIVQQMPTLSVTTPQPPPPLQTTPQMLPTATTAMPQQILLPNGQIITTAQIVATTGAPQLAQIISTNPQPSMTSTNPPTTNLSPQQTQMIMPQLIQSQNGHTLQIVQQPNGTQTLQLVQIVPQRSLSAATTPGLTTNMLTEHDVQLIEDDDVEEEFNDVYEQFEGKASGIETIVLEDDQSQEHHSFLKDNHGVMDEEDLTQSDTQELEYFEEMDSSTTQLHQHADEQMPDQLLHNECDEEDDDGFIIEEIQMDEEILEDDADENVMHVMQPGGIRELNDHDDCEYITDDPHGSPDDNIHEADNDDDDDLDYTTMEAEGDDVDGTNALLEEVDVQEALQLSDGSDKIIETLESSSEEIHQTTHLTNEINHINKRPRRANNNFNNCTTHNGAKLGAANSRQLAVAASVIAAAGSDVNYEIDTKLVTEFIRQQTSPLGSGRYICNLCNTEFRQFKGLQNHMHSHTNWIRANCKKQPQCEICHKSFKGPGMLRMHMKTHAAESIAPMCNICNKTFKSKAILYRHRQTHQQRAYSCGMPNCRKTFSNAINLRGHIERKHPQCTDKIFKCGTCDLRFENIDHLQGHVDVTGHGSNNDGMGQTNEFNSSEIANIVTTSPNIAATAVDTTVVMGTSGEVFFVTQT